MPDINDTLTVLYEILVDTSKTFEQEIIDQIMHPGKINDINRFTSLLTKLKDYNFIEPLLLQISRGEKGDVWLCDFLYAATIILDESTEEDEVATPKNLVGKLGSWIINHKGELAWMSASLLKFSSSKSTTKIQLQKLEERGAFF